ncbi:putative ATP-dependent 6-phosphofructokinase 5, chloroplastic [Cocos nucifera]|uniref:Putative ATP-dependent 6-phosphofructokinase 5, chloroplastic n=1 Tax=Cocos nucifera TaxID=13894 RepID=A0A8K0IT55_COCNU|nr:putative ATP-dependent 6-phosphofructokinase 5, chloroplastic [Cocos nucifera]
MDLNPSRYRRSDKKTRNGFLFMDVKAVATKPDIDFKDPNWKKHFQEDWDRRFNLPHLTDILDLKPRPTTFSLKKRQSIPVNHLGSPKNIDGASNDRRNDYVYNDDRALLKIKLNRHLLHLQVSKLKVRPEIMVIKYSSPNSAGAECIDPDCSWVEQWVHRAGPRKQIYFEPDEVKAGIVTCGGLCPGLNDVIRQIVFTLEKYGVQRIVGIPFGYRGFFEEGLEEILLSRRVVQNINLQGGSLLGVSRGGPNIREIVDNIQARGIDMLFVLGGNGTHAGANAIHNECGKRRMKVSVVCVPKTIDNDILLMDKTFGFDTAVEEAQRAINSAYIEAHSAYHGIGLVKLMGRDSGFIAMHASLSSGQIDICLIPEVPFALEGPYGVLRHLEHLIQTKGHAVVCVAEGAGQDFLQKSNATDASGNVVLSDIGVHIQHKIKKHFKDIGVPADVKYIDPTYMIRACRANASDAILCTVLGQNAVHGAFAGFSGITTGICNTHYVYLPIPEVIRSPRPKQWLEELANPEQQYFSRKSHIIGWKELNIRFLQACQVEKVYGMRNIDLFFRWSEEHGIAGKKSRILANIDVVSLDAKKKSATSPFSFDPNQTSKRRVRRGSDPIHNRWSEEHGIAGKKSRILANIDVVSLDAKKKSATSPFSFDPNQTSKRRVRRGSDPIHNRC